VVLGAQRSADPEDLVCATWVLDLDAEAVEWRAAAAFPGRAQLKVVATSQNTSFGEPAFFAYSGEIVGVEPTVEGDGSRHLPVSNELWRYLPTSDAWERLTSPPENPGRSAGVAWPVGQAQILFFSGVDQVPLDVPQAERAEFPTTMSLYDATIDAWHVLRDASMPRGVVTTGIARWGDGFAIASGEVRPGVRTAQVQFGQLERRSAPLAPLAYIVMVAYLLTIVGVGAYFARKERTEEDFFLGGRRIPWWAAGLSIYATQLSAITYVAIPGKAFSEDWVFALGSISLLAMAPIVIVFYLPFYRRLGIQTAYEYLELRFSLSVRLFGSASFMLFQVARMAIVVFLPSLALATVTGVDIYACIATIGLLATIYTVIGGFAAVVWTDVVQVFVLLGGVAVAMFLAVRGAGGFSEALSVAQEYGKTRAIAPGFSWVDSATWSVLVGGLFLQFGPYTADQAVVQRYLSTPDEKSAARAIWLNGLLSLPMTFVFFGVGSALFAYFRSAPALLEPGLNNDEIFPLFIALELPPLLSGLVLAGIFAASMSSLDSSMHAIATAWTNDWHDRLGIGKASRLETGRRVTLLMGIVGTGAALSMAAADLMTLYDVFQRVLGLLISPLAGLFILGIFTERATTRGAWAGTLTSICVLAYVQDQTPLNFMLYGAVGTLTAVLVGYAASVAFGAQPRRQGLTWRTLPKV
jgi:SSS family transporter